MTGRLFLFLFLLLSQFSFSQKNINRYRHKERQGLWIVYQDSTNTRIDNIGRYRRGLPKGTWKYYDANGKLIKKEKHLFRKIFIRQYHPNGKLQKKGQAKVVLTQNLIHYFYYGDWYVYDTSGTLIKKQFYKEGNKVSEISYQLNTEKKINDSLAATLRQLNTEIYKYSDSILNAERTSGKDSKLYQRYVSLSNLNAFKVLDELDKIIAKYGYPGKSLVGEDYAIAFSIISIAGIKYKEKYYDLIIEAANNKELDWTDVAFFVDKVKVAKKEKQVYGTQYKIEERTVVYYPIEDKVNLNVRRKKAGLEEMELTSINEMSDY